MVVFYPRIGEIGSVTDDGALRYVITAHKVPNSLQGAHSWVVARPVHGHGVNQMRLPMRALICYHTCNNGGFETPSRLALGFGHCCQSVLMVTFTHIPPSFRLTGDEIVWAQVLARSALGASDERAVYREVAEPVVAVALWQPLHRRCNEPVEELCRPGPAQFLAVLVVFRHDRVIHLFGEPAPMRNITESINGFKQSFQRIP